MAELLRETRELDRRSASDPFDYHHWFESIHCVEVEACHKGERSHDSGRALVHRIIVAPSHC